MLLSILKSEWYKLRKSKITSIIIAGPLLALFIGLTMNIEDMAGVEEVNEWMMTLLFMNLPYALLFLPLITGVFASVVCRYEHQAGGWKQLLTLPVTRGNVFIAKYSLVILLVLVSQVLYLGVFFAVGMIKGYTDAFPMMIIWKSILGGWIATFPLVALQLWMSIIWKNFATPLAVNVFFTLPGILAVNSETYGPFYPWAQPFLMMYSVDNQMDSVFFVPWDQVLTVVGGSFIIFIVGGYIYFSRKTV